MRLIAHWKSPEFKIKNLLEKSTWANIITSRISTHRIGSTEIQHKISISWNSSKSPLNSILHPVLFRHLLLSISLNLVSIAPKDYLTQVSKNASFVNKENLSILQQANVNNAKVSFIFRRRSGNAKFVNFNQTVILIKPQKSVKSVQHQKN